MITPRFSCSQNDRSVIVSAYCPAVRASEIEIHVDDTLLSLHVAPYFLRLSFPASVVEDDQSSAVYDPASGYLTLTLTKLNRGENFLDLDLLGKLLAPPPPAHSTPPNATIEVLSSQDTSGNTVTSDPDDTERKEILDGEHRHNVRVLLIMTNLSSICSCSQLVDNSSDCTRPTPGVGNIPSKTLWVPQRIYWIFYSRRHYGERDQRTRCGCRDSQSLRTTHPSIEARGVKMGSGVLHVRRPSNVEKKRNSLFIASSIIHPIIRADFADNEQVEELLAWTHPLLKSSSSAAPSPNAVIFTEAEKLAMLRLPRKECKNAYTISFISMMTTTQATSYYRPRLTSRNP